MDFLQLAGKTVLVCGLANRKSVAWHIGRVLAEAGAKPVFVVRTAERRDSILKWVGDSPVFVCDVEFPEQIARLADELSAAGVRLAGLVHSIAFADYAGGVKPFHETPKAAFLRAMDISCYSLIALSEACRGLIDPDGAVVTISISTTRMASENYGYMAPVKAALDSTLGLSGQIVQPILADPLQRRRAGLIKDLGIRRHPGLCRCVSVCRAGDIAAAGGRDGGGCQRCRVFIEPALQRHQCPANRRRCRHVGQLF